jgi:hypothetical protein
VLPTGDGRNRAGEYLQPSAHLLAVTQVALSNLADGDVLEFRFGSTSTSNSFQPLECDGLEYGAFTRTFESVCRMGTFGCRITPGASFSTLQEFDTELVANFRGELAVASQDIGDRELQTL